MASLSKRYTCNNGYDAYGNCYNAWDSWARWVVLAAIIIGALLLFFLFSCISARRRRKMGYAPYRGTGWVPGGGAPPPRQQYGYYGQNYNQAPPPAYAPNSYYGPQRETNDVEMQPPSSSYQPVYGNSYNAPPGAPPGKAGIIR